MFESISWKEFISGVAVLGGLYYAVMGLLLYREELQRLFRDGLVSSKDKSGEVIAEREASFMGGTARPVNRDERFDEELSFAPDNKTRPGDESDFTVSLDTTLVGTVADLGEDIKKLSSDISHATREQIVDGFRKLLKKYRKLDSTSYRSTINLLIAETITEKSSHAIDSREINSWWPQNEN